MRIPDRHFRFDMIDKQIAQLAKALSQRELSSYCKSTPNNS